jgi:protein gp37
MSETTGIKWTDSTFNIVWGCTIISPACQHCYAKSLSERFGFDVWGKDAPRRTFGEKHWREPLKWNATAEAEGRKHRVFCSSMADVFEDHPTVAAEREKLWPLIEATPWLEWQLLTKRPENIHDNVPGRWLASPPHNVWYGTTIENQDYLDARATALLSVPGYLHFFSCEPLLGAINLKGYRPKWIIAGGESGPHHRPLNLDYARSLRDQCRAKGISFFFKQVGGLRPDSGGDLLDGERIQEMPRVRG